MIDKNTPIGTRVRVILCIHPKVPKTGTVSKIQSHSHTTEQAAFVLECAPGVRVFANELELIKKNDWEDDLELE